MTETSLIYPTLDLFLYDLREGLGQTSTQVEFNRLSFWKKIYRQITKTQLEEELAKLEKPEADFVLLLGSKKIEKFASPSDGHYFPVQLGDTYALQVDYSGTYADKAQKTPNYAKQPAESTANLKDIIRSQIDNQQGTLGETWLLWAQLAADTQDAEKTAQECYTKLGGKSWKQDLQSQGKFLGADVFELWQVPSNWSAEWEKFSQENQHVIIFLFPATDDIKEIGLKMSKIYFDLMRLFCYRHKILWAYWQSCCLKAALKENYRNIREFNTRITKDLTCQNPSLRKLQEDLTEALKNLSDYTEKLNKLDSQARTIKTNLGNYQKRLKNFDDPDVKNSKVAFIIGVGEGDFAPAKYLEQVELDYANLTPGLNLLENLIRNIEGIIEIEQTRSDRSLTFIVSVASIGLALSGVTASLISSQLLSPEEPVISSQLPSPKEPVISSQLPSPKEPVQKGKPISLMDAFGWSLVPSFIFILAMLAWRKLRRN